MVVPASAEIVVFMGASSCGAETPAATGLETDVGPGGWDVGRRI